MAARLNKTGFICVTLVRDVSTSGKLFERYAAHLPLADGGRRKRSFAVGKYGRREAFRLAIEARRKAVAELMADRKSGIRKR